MPRTDRSMKGHLAVVLAVMLGLAVSVAAQGPRGPMGPPPGPGGPGGFGGGLPPVFMRVELTEQQRTQVRALVDEQRESRRAEMEERRTLHQQLTAAIFGSGGDTDAAAIVAKLAELQKQALDADVALQTKVAALLTNDQKEQIVTLEAQRPGPPPRTR